MFKYFIFGDVSTRGYFKIFSQKGLYKTISKDIYKNLSRDPYTNIYKDLYKNHFKDLQSRGILLHGNYKS